MKKRSISYAICLIVILLGFSACKKYLDAKPDQSIATPSTVEDLEGIINNYSFINARYPSASEVSSDDYYLAPADWSSLLESQRDYYNWVKYDSFLGDYISGYSAIEYANVVLDALPQVTGDQARKHIVNGNALFIRGAYHYALAQLYAKAYNASTAGSDLGIALRTTSDIAVKPVRSSVAETYAAILSDLQHAIPLLPASPVQKYQASKAAVYGMLARVQLSMSSFASAGAYADSALQIYSTLINYNTVSATAAVPFKQFNDEVIYDSRSAAPQALAATKARIDTLLYNSYAANDLRKTILFKAITNGSKAFKGNYTGLNTASLFTGIATDELYLIKAECAARANNTAMALSTLNTLLAARWKTGTYVPYTLSDPGQLLTLILQERRKELLFRSLRWTDLRRLNMDVRFTKTLIRNLNSTVYTLAPGSNAYVFQIDRSAVEISGLTQNP